MFTWLTFLTSLPSLITKLIDLISDLARGYKINAKRGAAEKWEKKQNENAEKRIQELLDKQADKDTKL